MIHRKKNRPALQRRDILTVSLVSFPFFIGNLLNSSSTQFLVGLLFLAFCTAPVPTKHFFLGLFSYDIVYPAILLGGFAPLTT